MKQIVDLKKTRWEDVDNCDGMDFNANPFIEAHMEKITATQNIRWTIEGFAEAWDKFITIHPSLEEVGIPQGKKFLKIVKFHFSYEPIPEFLLLKFKPDTTGLHFYVDNYKWYRAVFKELLVLREGTAWQEEER